jgi:hypothetical protein
VKAAGIALVALCGACSVAAPEVSEPADAPIPTECAGAYELAVALAAPSQPDGWAEWMAAEREHFCLASEVAAWHRERGGVSLSVSGCRYIPDDEGAERSAAIEHVLELAYPGIGFELAWRGSGDGRLQLDCPDSRGTLGWARVQRDGGAVHEVGHLLGLRHHYDTPDHEAHGDHMWSPDEHCTMDLTGGLDSGCAAALGAGPIDQDALDAAAWELYCAECARSDAPPAPCGGCP